jgi:hypothetical protein
MDQLQFCWLCTQSEMWKKIPVRFRKETISNLSGKADKFERLILTLKYKFKCLAE